MAMFETRVLREPWDVDRRLAEINLDRKRLLKAVTVAISASADATPFHPANAAGTFSYQQGTFALRNEFVGEHWQSERPEGVEVISNDTVKVKVAFQNVDIACNDDHPPKPRSSKGAGAERVSVGNLFGSLPHFARPPSSEWAIYYLMVDLNGAAELGCPIIKKNTFTGFVERIYLTDGSELSRIPDALNDGEIADDFDPQVARK